jgi:hypothetical protein
LFAFGSKMGTLWPPVEVPVITGPAVVAGTGVVSVDLQQYGRLAKEKAP